MTPAWLRTGWAWADLLLGGVLLALVVLAAVAGTAVWHQDPLAGSLLATFRPPGSVAAGAWHPLGTDQIGRDLLARLIQGTRISLVIVLLAGGIGAVLGTLGGMVAGYAGGWVDAVLMRLVDVQLAVPFILLILLIMAVLGPSAVNLVVVLGVTSWPIYARTARASVLQVRELEYVEGARAVGARPPRILLRHVLPNILPAQLVLLTLDLPRLVVLEASVGFLGLGVQPPIPTLGNLVGEGRSFLLTAQWLVVYPGLAIAALVVGCNLLGDGLVRALDARGAMIAFLLHRIGQSAIVLLGVAAIVFFSLFLTGDPAVLMLPPDASRAQVAAFRHAMGFDDPVPLQFLRYLGHVAQGDLGTSLRFGQPVLGLIAERLPATILLAVTALAWSTLAGFVLGVLAAVFEGRAVDLIVRLVALSGQAVPVFWLGLVLILVVSLDWGALPTGGYGTAAHLVLPALSLGAYYMSAVTRLVRVSLIEALRQDYVRTARAKGLTELRVVVRHALRNALVPVLTVQAIQFASLLGGALITEIVFAWPGIGRLAVQALQNRDFPLVQAVVLLAASAFVVINVVVDIAYAWLNPRVRV